MPGIRIVTDKKVLLRASVRAICFLIAGLTLAACDKCGNSIFRADAGPLACRDQAPR
jgi:hypothetical protein